MGKNLAVIGLFILMIISILLVQYNCNLYRNQMYNLTKEKKNLNSQYNGLKSENGQLNDTQEGLILEKENITNQINITNNRIKEINEEIQKAIQKKSTSLSKVAYLTFDDGPSPITEKVLDILKNYNVKATFFVNGRSDEYSKNLYRRIVNEGHSIGNHTYAHIYAETYKSVADFDADFNRLQNLIKDITGINMKIMRFPGGSNNVVSNHYSNGIMSILTTKYLNLGYQYFDWNVTAADTAENTTNDTVLNNIINGCSNKKVAIILMHDSSTTNTTKDTLPSIIERLQNMGYSFLPLDVTSPTIHFK